MIATHLVRTGAFGHVGAFDAADATRYPRGARVVVRSARGLEVGEVLAPHEAARDADAADGEILRGMTVEDELLELRLRKNRDTAFEACAARLAEVDVAATLVDVEHLFDGQTLVFYFLGQEPPQLESLVGELADLYDAKVQFRSFVEAATHGCGPGCGTEEAAGGGCTSCASGCAVSEACGAKRSPSARHGA